MKEENLIIFPKWKDDLEGKAKSAMQENDYKKAYDYFHQLTENGVHSHEVLTGKLICMMELNMDEEVESLCEQLIAEKDDYYASYVHIYATLLFQASKYKEVMYLIENALDEGIITEAMEEQLKQMYQLSKELQQQEDKKSYQEVLKVLNEAIDAKNDRQQWYMIKRLVSLNIREDIPLLREMLVTSDIHPVVKTAILEFYRKADITDHIEIEKFQVKDTIPIHNATIFNLQKFYDGVYQYLEEIEQNEPTNFQMIQFILERFTYVYVPFLPQEENYQLLAEALEYYVDRSLEVFDAQSVLQGERMMEEYIKMIDLSEALYGSILDV